MSRSYEVLSLTRASAVVRCGNCDIRHTVDLDEDGEPCLETTRCHHDETIMERGKSEYKYCAKRLCVSCPQFECSMCQLTYCLEHMVEYSGLKLCPVCMKLMADEAAAEAKEASEHSCLDHAHLKESESTEPHGERVHEEWWECSVCGAKHTTAEMEQMAKQEAYHAKP